MFLLLKAKVIIVGMTILLDFGKTNESSNCSAQMQENLKILMGKAYLPSMMMSTRNDVDYNKRSDIHRKLTWSCVSEYEWQDLGPNYYPRYIRAMRCVNPVCWHGLFICKEKKFTLQVLRQISDKQPVCNFEPEFHSEGDLSQNWKFVEHSVTVCCECSR